MLVGFDVSQTGAGKAGCGYLAHGLVHALAARGVRFVFYPHFGDLYWEPRPGACSCPGEGRRGPTFRWFERSKRFWREPPEDFEARLGGPDVVHSNNFFCPVGLKRARQVYTLYDLSFLENPGWTTEQNRVGCLDGVFGASLRADWIVSISRASLEHFLRVFPHYPRERTSVMHLASRFGLGSAMRVPARLKGVEPGKFWLCVGTIEPRKNQERLFEALARLGGKRPLVLAGGRGWLMDEMGRKVNALGLASRVKLTGYVDDAELAWLYANCFGFVYPSLFEGFGLPVLEAMSLGAPVITSGVSSLPEVAGDAALLVDPLDAGSIAAAMARLESDEVLRRELSRRGEAQAARFSWDAAAGVALEAYGRVLELPLLGS
ncbi:N-acetylgalactosamine-N, N'-diacetylbacillosaminyl-diphospho-undecaprenol4-alpha-N-acetylgalactosaminyltransferase [Fundidesulfovibrio magnetotacticus]|uniref:N-acetylgalactosamine-N, N'-diacetylbacillosaminyl-diphospho-undecaprenol 4-alpha-N-acetylgalactosaminyltransferase n=1 Tax=Fundidesulfovibrio magnetotacticus TaxID=2730080 RepID=A0A6V8LR73_9BACT|nr:glycosyltransferase family 1 protein [Fundidesulfovibrio magnetotacticus]GFK92629.1 N-acetylgalactosamine-N, N'-diacetylbacillosaminyl-diphospho-undecaprenol4-alpha-N-acetylgalactosaminyltransferase [Fundidesulfovibrio magnetotacticus]